MHAFLTAVRSAPAMRLHPWIRTAKSPERPTCCLSPHHNHIHFPAQAAPLPEYTFGVLIAWCRSSRLPESSSGTHRGLVHPHHSRTASSACGRCQPLCRRATAVPRRSRAAAAAREPSQNANTWPQDANTHDNTQWGRLNAPNATAGAPHLACT